ncbi:MAG: hypothetical protein AB7S38_30010 [Vulcanimicrobiota bacterium]
MRIPIAIFLGLVAVLLAILGLHEIGTPTATRPGDFDGTVGIEVLIDWAPDLQRIEEDRTAWWWPGCRQARHFYYGKTGEQLVWLDVMRTTYSDKRALDREFTRQSQGTKLSQMSVNGQTYRLESSADSDPDSALLLFSYNDEPVGLRILQRRGFELVSTTLIGLFPVSAEARARLVAQ